MNFLFYDPEDVENDLLDYYSDDYVNEDIGEGEDDAGEAYYNEEQEAGEARRSAVYYGAQAARIRAARAAPVRARYGYVQRYPSIIRYPQRPLGGAPAIRPEPGDYPQEPLEPGEPPQEPMEPGEFPQTSMKPDYAEMWPEETETRLMNGEKDYMTDFAAGCEPALCTVSTKLAEALRQVLHEDYQNAAPEEMEEALFRIVETMTPAEGINFGKVLSQIGNAGQKILKDPAVSQIAASLLPVAGSALGTFVGGPAGTVIGGKLGQIAGQALSKGSEPATEPPARTAVSPQGGSVAAAQLLHLTQDSNVLKSLAALAMGSSGRKSIQVGKDGPSVNVGAIMTLLHVLSGKGAADADKLVAKTDGASEYLLDSEGNFVCDPAVPEARAQALYRVLLAAENQEIEAETKPQDPWSKFFPFGRETRLLIEHDAPGPFNPNVGTGVVLEHTSNRLKVRIDIPKKKILGQTVPETTAVFDVEYEKEGGGNRANIVVNGERFTDNNVRIRSKGNTREISMSIKILGQEVDRITVSKSGSKEAILKFKTGRDEHALILSEL